MIIHDVEQRSNEWFSLRAGIPTASNADKLITGTGKESKQVTDYAYQLAGELYAGMPLDAWGGNDATQRGTELEPMALTAYAFETGVWSVGVGFCTTDDESYGCSPDGFVDDAGMVEIKCLAAKNHVKNTVYYSKHKKAMPDYIAQVQMQLLITGRKWCDIVFYHPELPMLIIRIEPDKKIQEVLVKQLELCLDIRDKALEILKG